VAAVIAAVVSVLVPSSSPKPAYTNVPFACGVVSQATLARYLPNPTGIAQLLPTNGTYQAVIAGSESTTCKWSSVGGGEDRTLVATAVIYGPSSGVTAAQQAYHAAVASLGCRCRGVSVSARPVTGLGDQAEEFFVTPSVDATAVTAPNASSPGANLIVRSSNAGIYLEYAITATTTGAALPPSRPAAQLTWLASVARDILAAFARPDAVSSAMAPFSNEPQYTASRDPCLLITAATLAKYAPGASVSPVPSAPSPGIQQRTCSWDSNELLVLLTLDSYPNSPDANQIFMSKAESFSGGHSLVTVTGSVWMPDLGEGGLAIFQTQLGTGRGVELFVWSGNAEIDLWLNYAGPAVPGRAELLMASRAMARDVLAALAQPAASSQPNGPLYASPSDACALIKASTLVTYAPGAGSGSSWVQSPAVGEPPSYNCDWVPNAGSVSLSVTTYADIDSAQGGYETDLGAENQPPYIRVLGTQQVKGLGEQATAFFETGTDLANSPAVSLYVWSGNAEIEVQYSQLGSRTLVSRADMLAADIAMARDVLADLPVKRLCQP